MMKRQIQNQVRRSFRTLGHKLSRVRDRAATYVRRRSSYDGRQLPSRPFSMVDRPSRQSIHDDTDDDSDAVFEPASEIESSEEDVEPAAVIYLPCEFCHGQQIAGRLRRHQNICTQNPTNIRRRRNSSDNDAPRRPPRLAASESAVAPSAPPRSRSPSPVSQNSSPPSRSTSPTCGYSAPPWLVCPITHAIFHDPVVASDGHTYERQAILQWFRNQTTKESPVTREPIFRDKINPNRLIRGQVDDFIAECQEKSLRFQYRLDVHLKKSTPEPFINTETKTVYHAEWIKKRSSPATSRIILIHFTGEHAEQLAKIYSELAPHPNIAPILGRVEHPDSGILLVQDYSPAQTLSQLIAAPNPRITIATLDLIVQQIVSVFQHLENTNINRTKITTDHFLVYRLDHRTRIKLVHIDITNESNERFSEVADMQTLGELVQGIYGIANIQEEARVRQSIFQDCFAANSYNRSTLDQLTDLLSAFIDERKM